MLNKDSQQVTLMPKSPRPKRKRTSGDDDEYKYEKASRLSARLRGRDQDIKGMRKELLEMQRKVCLPSFDTAGVTRVHVPCVEQRPGDAAAGSRHRVRGAEGELRSAQDRVRQSAGPAGGSGQVEEHGRRSHVHGAFRRQPARGTSRRNGLNASRVAHRFIPVASVSYTQLCVVRTKHCRSIDITITSYTTVTE